MWGSAAIFFAKQRMLADAEREIGAALAGEPTNPRYLLARMGIRLAQVDRAAGAGSERIKSERMKKELMAGIEELSRFATSPMQRTMVGLFHLELGKEETGEALISGAVRDDPSCAMCQGIHAEVLFHNGRIDEASSALDRARAMSSHGEELESWKKLEGSIEAARKARGH